MGSYSKAVPKINQTSNYNPGKHPESQQRKTALAILFIILVNEARHYDGLILNCLVLPSPAKDCRSLAIYKPFPTTIFQLALFSHNLLTTRLKSFFIDDIFGIKFIRTLN
jgi:hypothetical protein